MRYIKPIINMVLPTAIFYAVYKILGILPAILLSLAIHIVAISIQYKKEQSIANTQVLGLLGGIFSALTIINGGSEKFTFVPALVQNIVMSVFFIYLTLRKKSVIHYLLKDFGIKSFEKVEEEKLLPVNLIWTTFFLLKIAAKILGMIWLDYDKLYWIVFLMGDPAFVVVVIVTILIVHNSKER